jgi:hypothetical protein
MTVSDTSTADLDPRIRIAQKHAACAAPGCLHPIWPGLRIVKRPNGGWQHADCSHPGSGRRRKDRW